MALRVLASFGPISVAWPMRNALLTYVLGHLFDRYLELARTERAVRIDVDEARRIRLGDRRRAPPRPHRRARPGATSPRSSTTSARHRRPSSTPSSAWPRASPRDAPRLEAAFDDSRAPMADERAAVARARRVVVKIGSRTLAGGGAIYETLASAIAARKSTRVRRRLERRHRARHEEARVPHAPQGDGEAPGRRGRRPVAPHARLRRGVRGARHLRRAGAPHARATSPIACARTTRARRSARSSRRARSPS